MRDGEDGFLYVLDANNTPTGPCRLLAKRERYDALSTLAETFDKVFLSVRADVRSLEIGLTEGITAINEKKGGDSFTSNPKTVLQSQRMPSESRCGANKLQSRRGTCFALTRKSRSGGNSSRTKMTRLVSFPVFLFLSLAALFLFGSWLGYSSKPRAMVGSAKAIEPPAVQKAIILINPNAVGQFTDPPGIKAPMVDQRVDFSVDTPLQEVMRKLSVVPSYPKDHVHSRFDVKTRHEARPTAHPATRRSNFHPRDFFSELEHQFAAFVLRLQFTGATGRFVDKDVLIGQTNGRWRKKMPINERRIRTWLTSSSRPVRSN